MYADVMTRDQTEGLTAEVGSMGVLSARLRRQMAELDAVVAEYRAREKEPGRETELASIRSELRSAAARAEYLKKQISELESDMVRKRSLLLQSTARRDQARGRRDAARDAYDGADKRLREVKNGAGYRGERLSIIDPGIVPERPSSPNAPLNVFSACLASLVFSVVWVTFEHSLARERRESVRAALRAAGKGHDV